MNHNPEWTDDELKLIAVAVKVFCEQTLNFSAQLSPAEITKVQRVGHSVQHKCEIFKPEHNPEIVLPRGFTL